MYHKLYYSFKIEGVVGTLSKQRRISIRRVNTHEWAARILTVSSIMAGLYSLCNVFHI